MKWFRHETQANRNSKLEKVLLKYGSDGYALYWLCLEYIADRVDSKNADFELHHDAEILAIRLKVQQSRVEEIMKYMVTINLFEESDGVVTCMRMANMIENQIVKNPQIKALQEKIRENPGKIRENPGQIRLHENRLHENTRERENAPVPGVGSSTPEGYQEVVKTYYDRHQEKTGTKPLIDSATGKIIKDLIKLQGSVAVISKLEAYYTVPQWFTKDGNFGIKAFRQHYDAIKLQPEGGGW